MSRHATRGKADFDPSLQAQLAAVLRSPGQSLDPPIRASMESYFGRNFSRVRIHADAAAAATADLVDAAAYTVGRHVVFAAGRYAPFEPGGRRLLAHELTHVLQQERLTEPDAAEISVSPTDDAFEREAERSADLVMAAEQGGVSWQKAAPPIAAVRAPRLQRKTCGPKVDTQVKDIWTKIGSDFNSWSITQAEAACRHLVQPLVSPGLFKMPEFNVDAFDTLPLFYYGAINWLLDPDLLARGCCDPSISQADANTGDPQTQQSKCEDGSSCCSTVQIGGKCWLSGTVNYGTYGVMVKACRDRFPILLGPKFTIAARALLVAYKSIGHLKVFGGATTPEADVNEPLAWYDATFQGGLAPHLPDPAIDPIAS